MANISLVKPDKSMYSMAIDCVVTEDEVTAGEYVEVIL